MKLTLPFPSDASKRTDELPMCDFKIKDSLKKKSFVSFSLFMCSITAAHSLVMAGLVLVFQHKHSKSVRSNKTKEKNRINATPDHAVVPEKKKKKHEKTWKL